MGPALPHLKQLDVHHAQVVVLHKRFTDILKITFHSPLFEKARLSLKVHTHMIYCWTKSLHLKIERAMPAVWKSKAFTQSAHIWFTAEPSPFTWELREQCLLFEKAKLSLKVHTYDSLLNQVPSPENWESNARCLKKQGFHSKCTHIWFTVGPNILWCSQMVANVLQVRLFCFSRDLKDLVQFVSSQVTVYRQL